MPQSIFRESVVLMHDICIPFTVKTAEFFEENSYTSPTGPLNTPAQHAFNAQGKTHIWDIFAQHGQTQGLARLMGYLDARPTGLVRRRLGLLSGGLSVNTFIISIIFTFIISITFTFIISITFTFTVSFTFALTVSFTFALTVSFTFTISTSTTTISIFITISITITTASTTTISTSPQPQPQPQLQSQ
ncbi:hypothetical protein AYL99_11841 [Fonsecaea erecta]|uniref:Uncharacterized protein n=1 Tax=Fonsecaea erecta TaxID=1367422 RepID=A0A178Z361_9EURO|nr:hypothetical protein AYL99_11841 [Fonsecaea erecta]OAP53961.1 hypothetical protein AYL99_11841 [Fonsecaea erecta]